MCELCGVWCCENLEFFRKFINPKHNGCKKDRDDDVNDEDDLREAKVEAEFAVNVWASADIINE